MVPLRFVSEALGAEVKWDGANRTVRILDQAPTASDPPVSSGQPPVIDSVIHNAGIWAEGGSITVHGCTIEGNAMSVSSSGNTQVTMAGNTIRLNTLNNGSLSLSPFAQRMLRR